MKNERRSSPTMQDIADDLGISRVTVWKVFENKAGVSDGLRLSVIQKAKELGYKKRFIPQEREVFPTEENVTISLIVSRPESASFWINIVHHIAKALAKKKINLLYTYVPSVCPQGYTLPDVVTNTVTQGLITINIYDEKMLALINEQKKPKVFLDVINSMDPYALDGDVVFLEGEYTIREITNHLIKNGRKRLSFIGDIQYAHTNYDRYRGFLRALEENHLKPFEQGCLIEPMGIYDLEEQVHAFLAGLTQMPDGFVCANDQLAYFVSKYLLSKGYKIPQQVAITGYDGVPEYRKSEGIVATALVDTAGLGKKLANRLIFLMKNTAVNGEVSYVKPTKLLME